MTSDTPASAEADLDAGEFRRDVVQGLTASPKTLPHKYFYDEEGARLFDEICRLDEYYPTRTETAIMEANSDEIAALLGPRCALIEYGSGSSRKTQILLDHLETPAAYVPIDISETYLEQSTARLHRRYPSLTILPVIADYTRAFSLPELPDARRRVVYFPGSTIGNFRPGAATDFLIHIASVCGDTGGLLIGVDLKKDADILEAAYNDARGVTARFNLNLLARANRELDADFDLEQFTHRAVYNAEEGRVEMYLVSRARQRVRLGDTVIDLEGGEQILTEYSHKYSTDDFSALARKAGFCRARTWTDEDQMFSVHYLVPA